MYEMRRNLNNKTYIFLSLIIIAAFGLGFALPIGIDKISKITVEILLYSTYTVFTQFGFLLFTFLMALNIQKEYSNKTILYYKFYNYSSVRFFFEKILSMIVSGLILIVIGSCIISLSFMNFTYLLVFVFYTSLVYINIVIIVSLISYLSRSILIAIGLSVLVWLLGVILISFSSIFKFLAYYDATNDLHGHISNYFSQGIQLGGSDFILPIVYTTVILGISYLVVKLTPKRWITLGL